MKFSECIWIEMLNWKENFFLLVYIILGCRLAIMFYEYPPMVYVTFGIGLCYSLWTNYTNYGWHEIGRISHIYSFISEETKQHFVIFTQDENSTNRVIQHFYASMDEKLLKSRIEKETVLAIDEDGSLIEVYSCDPGICHHVNIMAHWCFTWSPKLEGTVCIGITKQNWVSNDEKIWRTPLVMLDVDNPEDEIYSRFRNPQENFVCGQSCTWEVDLKIQNVIYSDVSICMHVFEDPSIPLYENFWMYGVYCDLKLVYEEKIAVADDVSIRYTKRKNNLLKY